VRNLSTNDTDECLIWAANRVILEIGARMGYPAPDRSIRRRSAAPSRAQCQLASRKTDFGPQAPQLNSK
jgi:hypothetical protein